jgi:ProP effector
MKLGLDPAVLALIKLLCERFPLAFFLFEQRRRPLKVGIHRDILAALAGVVSESELSIALRVYVSNKAYRSRLVVGATRIDLNGEGAGIVTPEQTGVASKHNAVATDTTPPTVKRLGLADLKAAALRRKASGGC